MKHSSIETMDVSAAGQNDWMLLVVAGAVVLAVLMALFHPLFRRDRW